MGALISLLLKSLTCENPSMRKFLEFVTVFRPTRVGVPFQINELLVSVNEEDFYNFHLSRSKTAGANFTVFYLLCCLL